jgi:hypothetical protein
MAHHKRYLAPEDVADVYAAQTLEALNAMRSARHLADAVDVPGEPDIGVRLAQRILDRRDELGGFTSLLQVYEVPLIGPERFTEIVVCLSDAPWPDRPVSPLDLLRQEVNALRRQVQALGTLDMGRRVTLRAVQPQPFLGQTVTILATVTDGAGEPAVGVPVTILATRGRLSTGDGYTAARGHLVTARTGLQGRLRVTLSLPTSEELSPLQLSALSQAIESLGTAAASPLDALQGLRELARQYRWEVNLPLRQAVDLYARDFAAALLGAVPPREPLAAWRLLECGLLAFAPLADDGETASSVAATATLNLGFRDWIHPFLVAAVEMEREETDLRERLRSAVGRETDSSRLVGEIYARAGEFVAAHRGLVGGYVGRKVAESSIRDFMERELPESLPLEARAAVVPALNAASRTIAAADSEVLQGLVRTRTELKADLDTRVDRELGDMGAIAERVGALENLPGAVDSLRTELAASIAQVHTALDQRIEAIQVDLRDFQLRFDDVFTLADFQQATAGFVTRNQLDAALADRVTRQQFEAELRTRVTTQQLNTALQGKADIATVNQRFTQLDSSVAELRLRPR